MNGSLAVLFLIASLSDMALNDCPAKCLALEKTESRLSLQVANVEFQKTIVGTEIYVGYDFGMSSGPFQPTVGASVTHLGDVWLGGGAKWTTLSLSDGPLFVESSLMTGLYAQGDGPDIGGSLQFRSSLGVGYLFDNSMTILMSYDHRSNADTQDTNPGLETVAVRVAFAF